jgi:hypothetical protein
LIIKSDRPEILNSQRFYLDFEAYIQDAKEIILANAEISKLSYDILNGEIRILYNVKYNVIYKNATQLNKFEDEVEKTTQIKDLNILSDYFVDIDVTIVAVEHTGITNLRIRVEIEIKGYYLIEELVKVPEICSDIFVKTEERHLQHLIPLKESTFNLTEEFEIKEGISRVFASDSRIIVDSTACNNEICTIKGDCLVNIIYLFDGNLCARCFALPFTVESLVSNPGKPESIFCQGRVLETELNTDGETAENEATSIKIIVSASTKGYAVVNEIGLFPSDAYSERKELDIKYANFKIAKNIVISEKKEKVRGMVRLNDDDILIRSILATSSHKISAFEISNVEGLKIEGIISIKVIYLNKEVHVSSILAEIPYHFILDNDFDKNVQDFFACAYITDVCAKAKHNNEIEIDCDIRVEISGKKSDTIKYIEAINECGDLVNDIDAITIYVAKEGESLWEVSKALKCDSNKLLELNPELRMPVCNGQKVMIYRQLECV